MIIQALKQYGLSDKEADVYLLCLEYGIINASKIASKVAINRTTCYDLLATMIKKGFISETMWKGVKHYEAVSPDVLLAGLSTIYTSFESIVPELLSVRNRYGIRPKIKVFEGLENVKQMYMDMLIPDTTIYTILGYEIVNQDFLQWRDTFFVPERVKNNIHIHVLSAQTPLTDQYREHDSDTLRETRYLRNVTKELGCGRFIYGESKCLLIIYDSKDISGLIIESQSIHDLSSIVFDQIRSLL